MQNDLTGNIRESKRDPVNAQHLKRDELGQDQTIGLKSQERERGANEDPASEVHQGANAFLIPGKTRADFREHPVTGDRPGNFGDDSSRHQGPDGWLKPGPNYGNRELNQLREELERGELADPHVPGEGQQTGGADAGNDAGEAERRQQGGNLRLMIKAGHRPRDGNRKQPQPGATNHLKSPRGIQKSRFVSARILNHAVLQADVRKQIHAHKDGCHQGH